MIALAQHLKSIGMKPGLVSRGYGGRAPDYPLEVDANADAREAGDEPVMLQRRTGCPLVVDPNRVNAVKHLLARNDCDIVIADDGLQHYALARDLEIALIDGDRGLGNGRCLPAGPLREPASRLNEVDLVVVNGGTAPPDLRTAAPTSASAPPATGGNAPLDAPSAAVASASASPATGGTPLPDLHTAAPVLTMQLAPTRFVRVADGAAQPTDFFNGKQVHAVAGIGNPQRFFNALAGLGCQPSCHAFPDHHPFTAEDLAFGDSLPIIMTEKDAVRLPSLGAQLQGDLWYLEVAAQVDLQAITKLIEKAKARRDEVGSG